MSRRDRSLREATIPQRRRTPSFSSSLLDAIYRSIDESNNAEGEDKTLTKKQKNFGVKHDDSLDEASVRRAIMIEKWMEKQSSLGSLHSNNSTSSSSDSSCMFSSSEAESSYKEKSRRSKPARYSMKCMQFEQRNEENGNHNHPQTPKREGGFTKTKLKALKIYGELKKVKQPISPGGRITSFLNSIFSSGNAKKVNVCTVKAMEDVNFDRQSKSASAWSSATSFSRSCLSKTSSNSRGKYSSNGTKRSVRFYPVSVIVDEDCRPCGHKCIYEDDPSLMPLPNVHHQQILNNCSLKEEMKKRGTPLNTLLAQDYLSSYPKKGISEFVSRGFADNDYEHEDDDALSYSSSDLFELDHLIGIGRYREEEGMVWRGFPTKRRRRCRIKQLELLEFFLSLELETTTGPEKRCLLVVEVVC